MGEAYLVEAVRTPVGRRNGGLSTIHSADLGAHVLKGLMDRSGVDPNAVEDVVFGCCDTIGSQAGDIARSCWLAAGLPMHVPGVTIDRQCGSSQQSAHFAAQGVMAGVYDVVVAAGVESMTRVPMGITFSQGPGKPFGERMRTRYSDELVPQGISAEMIAAKWGLSREDLDRIGYDSHTRAARAATEGRFDSQIIPIEVKTDEGSAVVQRDEGIRPDTSMEILASLKPAFQEDGVVTAGNSSQITDGAAALLITSPERAKEFGWEPKARFVSFSLAGTNPVMMLEGPIPATEKALGKAGLAINDIDLFEVNEAFAAVIGAWLADTGADWEKTNVNGGAIALGHPLGASGARLMTTLVHELERSGGRYGLQTMCEGGGTANGTILENLT